jgi:FkbM family methyltransferase
MTKPIYVADSAHRLAFVRRLARLGSRCLRSGWEATQTLIRGTHCRPRLSYSQSGEDVIVRFLFEVLGIPRPSYLDIGAHDPFHFSNTAHFYLAGSRGVNVEPNPFLYRAFTKHRPRDLNLNLGVGTSRQRLPFYVVDPATMSTFSAEDARLLATAHGFRIVEVLDVEVVPLSEVLSHPKCPRLPDFLSIDVEGLDAEIIGAIDFSAWSPLVICCETAAFTSKGPIGKKIDLIEYVKRQGYLVYADTMINTIFVREDAWRNR